MENFKKCKVENCKNEYNTYKKGGGLGYCNRHYHQIYRWGKILKRTKFDPNEITDCGDYYEICLYNRKHEEVGRAKIDKEDLEKVKNYKWYLMVKNSGGKYVISSKDRILLQHLILGKPPIGYEVDHKFRNTLDNRKSKLRFATNQQNKMNRKAKGYSWDKKNKKWQARIGINGKNINLGRFTDEQTAAKVAKESRQKYFGEFAYKN